MTINPDEGLKHEKIAAALYTVLARMTINPDEGLKLVPGGSRLAGWRARMTINPDEGLKLFDVLRGGPLPSRLE